MVKHLVAVVFLFQGPIFLAGQDSFLHSDNHIAGEFLSERDTVSVIDKKIGQDDRRNYLGAGLLDPLLYGNLRFIYERRFGPGSFSVCFPLTIGMNADFLQASDFRERNLDFRTGAGFNFYVPRPRGPSWLILGTGIFGGRFHCFSHESWTNESRTFLALNTNCSIHLHLSNTFILATGVDVSLLGYNYLGYIYSPKISMLGAAALRIDLLFNLK
ncbi:MAG TPA: hypothetical protein ENO05_06885 [Bacteroides sp.]|nr:hypothetical protein [Bacteroides sp.]